MRKTLQHRASNPCEHHTLLQQLDGPFIIQKKNEVKKKGKTEVLLNIKTDLADDKKAVDKVCSFPTKIREWKNAIQEAERLYLHKHTDGTVNAIAIIKGCGSQGCKA